MYKAINYVSVKRHVYKKGETITTEMEPEVIARLLLLGAICVVAPEQPGEEVLEEATPETSEAVEAEDLLNADSEFAEIDASEGIVQAPEPVKTGKKHGRKGGAK